MRFVVMILFFFSLRPMLSATNITVRRLPDADQSVVMRILGEGQYEFLKPSLPLGFMITGEIDPDNPIMAMGGRLETDPSCQKGQFTFAFILEASPRFGEAIYGYIKTPLIVFPSGVIGPGLPASEFSNKVLSIPHDFNDERPPAVGVLDFILMGDGTVIGEDSGRWRERLINRPEAFRKMIEGMNAAVDQDAYLKSIGGGWLGVAAQGLLHAPDRKAEAQRLLKVRGLILIPKKEKGELQ